MPPPEPRRYGDRGTPELALGLGYSSLSGFLAAGGFRYFVLDGVVPGVEATYVSGGRSVCNDLSTCVLQGPVLGLRLVL